MRVYTHIIRRKGTISFKSKAFAYSFCGKYSRHFHWARYHLTITFNCNVVFSIRKGKPNAYTDNQACVYIWEGLIRLAFRTHFPIKKHYNSKTRFARYSAKQDPKHTQFIPKILSIIKFRVYAPLRSFYNACFYVCTLKIDTFAFRIIRTQWRHLVDRSINPFLCACFWRVGELDAGSPLPSMCAWTQDKTIRMATHFQFIWQ